MADLKLSGRLRAIAWLRFSLWRHGLRRSAGVLDTGVGLVLALLGAAASLGLAIVFAFLFRNVHVNDSPDGLLVVLYIDFSIMTLFAVVVPVIAGGGKDILELPRLAMFPLSRRTIFGLGMAASTLSALHFLWYPTLAVTATWTVVLAHGNRVAGLLVLAAFATLLVVGGKMVLMLLEAVMRRRSVRELLGIGAFTVLMAVALVPALIDSGVIGSEGRPVLLDILAEIFRPIAAELPPALAAEALADLFRDGSTWPLAPLLKLAVWIAGCLVVAYGVFSKYLIEPTGRAGHHARTRVVAGPATGGRLPRLDPLGMLPDTLAAVVGKELRYLARSTPGKLVLLVSPLFVTMIALAVGRLSFVKEPLWGLDPAVYAFHGVILYVGLLSSNFLVNAYAWEGDGMKAYLIGPLPARHVILGKNLAVLAFQIIPLLESLLLWGLIRGIPGASAAIGGAFVFYTGILVLMAAGNFVSLTHPVKRSIAAVTNSASNIGTLVSFAAVVVSALLVAPILLIATASGSPVVLVFSLALLVAALAGLNTLLLGPAADLFEQRSEALTETLAGE